jgi:hypothetical protein
MSDLLPCSSLSKLKPHPMQVNQSGLAKVIDYRDSTAQGSFDPEASVCLVGLSAVKSCSHRRCQLYLVLKKCYGLLDISSY